MKRVHVVGLSPRTGTTLMAELLAGCYRIDGHAEHEMSIFARPMEHYSVFCSKLPGDLVVMPWLLPADEDLWAINMVRDPRDVVVSRHARDPSAYWVHLGVWKERRRIASRLRGHPRFVEVRYEDLVRTPEAVQDEIERRLPFLERTGRFVDFHRRVAPSAQSLEALGGVRPIETSGIGKWRANKARLAAQMERHGDIDAELQEFGYEADSGWRLELADVIPDNGRTHFPEKRSMLRRSVRALRRARATAGYLLRLYSKR